MKRVTLQRISAITLALGTMLLVTGCDGANAQITLLDVINTILLGVTAAGAVVLIENV